MRKQGISSIYILGAGLWVFVFVIVTYIFSQKINQTEIINRNSSLPTATLSPTQTPTLGASPSAVYPASQTAKPTNNPSNTQGTSYCGMDGKDSYYCPVNTHCDRTYISIGCGSEEACKKQFPKGNCLAN